MKFASKIKLKKEDIEKIILDHLRAKGKPEGAIFKKVYFNVVPGGRSDFGGYDPAVLYGAEIDVELELE